MCFTNCDNHTNKITIARTFAPLRYLLLEILAICYFKKFALENLLLETCCQINLLHITCFHQLVPFILKFIALHERPYKRVIGLQRIDSLPSAPRGFDTQILIELCYSDSLLLGIISYQYDGSLDSAMILPTRGLVGIKLGDADTLIIPKSKESLQHNSISI